jgi:light-regulated signal transduction histidine kinase (bacteriophytochrome)
MKTPDYKKELEEFAYIVSHDLNAQLRHVREFGKLLIANLGDKVTGEEREYLMHMENGVYKTEAMLQALLEYSRLNTQGEKFKTLDCDALVQSIIEHIEDTSVTITVSGLPDALHGDEKQIRLLFTHLIDNSLKFRRENVSPIIEIFAEEKSDDWHFSVTDNGIGIPEQHCENVFRIFQRLAPEDYSGIGSGLAIAKKIVEHHNGDIKVASGFNKKTSVLFSIPTRPKNI